jgi:hypothetical protein
MSHGGQKMRENSVTYYLNVTLVLENEDVVKKYPTLREVISGRPLAPFKKKKKKKKKNIFSKELQKLFYFCQQST